MLTEIITLQQEEIESLKVENERLKGIKLYSVDLRRITAVYQGKDGKVEKIWGAE